MAFDHSQTVNAIQQLHGILEGIACDYSVNEAEVSSLQQWLEQHADLLQRSPFDDLGRLLARVMADGCIDDTEHEELLDWFAEFGDEDSPSKLTLEDATQRLAGAIQGVLSDGVLRAAEVASLKDWMRDFERFSGLWPFEEIWAQLRKARGEGDIVLDEQTVAELRRLLSSLEPPEATSGQIVGPAAVTVRFDKEPSLQLAGRSFCFSGEFEGVSRTSLADLVMRAGGIPKTSVSKKLDYLVVGKLGSSAWAFAGYGTKVASLLANREEGANTKLICEADFLAALEKTKVLEQPVRLPGSQPPAPRGRPFAIGGLSKAGAAYGWNELRYAVIDFETTGFSPERDRVIEVAAVTLDSNGKIEDELSTLVHPRRKVAATRIHGITDDDVKDAPTFDQILGHLLRRLSGRVVVAHNADFDGAFLWAECFAARFALPLMPALCTVKLARSMEPEARAFSLDACCRRLGISFAHLHSALDDCRATAGILREWIRHGKEVNLRGPSFPVRFPMIPEVAAPVALYPRWAQRG